MRCLKSHRLFLLAAGLLALLVNLPVIDARAAERPPVAGRNAAVSAGHPLTTAAALEVLMRGGNAFDAGVAARLPSGADVQDNTSLGREALVLVHPRDAGKVTS